MSELMPTLTKEDGQSKDLVKENIGKLKQLFPEIVTDGKIDFETLKEELGEFRETDDERYSFTWNGKSKARKLAMTPSRGTLRPAPEESVNWDSTENLFIEGDNLEVLKLLQRSYHKKVKMIYIDPPYNTGNDFVYKDDYKDNLSNYLKLTGQLDGEGKKISSNPEYSGRYHTDWLNMMYPRLKLARELLKEDGVIFASINDNEFSNLRKVLDWIFGEVNFIGCITRVSKSTSFRGNFIAPGKDYLMCYAKNINTTSRFVDDIDDSQYKKIEKTGNRKGERYRDDIAFYLSTLETRPNQRYFIECPDGSKVIPPGKTIPPEAPKDGDGVWRWNKDSFERKKDLIVFKKSKRSPLINEDGNQANYNLYTKSYLSDKKEKGNIPRDLWSDFLNREGTKELKELEIPFNFPKPTSLIQKMLKVTNCESGDIILDFFAGSCSTSSAVLKYSLEKYGDISFISIQIPESVEEKSKAQKKGFDTIADIGKERIRRDIKKIKKENPDYDGDLGFKVFKLDSSNNKPWDPDFDEVQLSIEDSIENVKPDRSEQDLLYEILLKYGIDLSLPIKEREIAGSRVYIGGAGALVLCPSGNITLKAVEGMAAIKEEFEPEIMRVVLRDSGFKDDVVKTNAIQILKQHGIEDVRSI